MIGWFEISYLSHTNTTTSKVSIEVHAISNLDTSWWITVSIEKLQISLQLLVGKNVTYRINVVFSTFAGKTDE